MTGPITFEIVGTVVAVLIAAAAVWGHVNRRLAEIQRDYRAQILAMQTEQNALRLQLTRDYASVQHLEKVEARLAGALERLIEKVEALGLAMSAIQGPPSKPRVRRAAEPR